MKQQRRESSDRIRIDPAVEADVPVIRSFILALAEYERLSHEVVMTDELLRRHLFGERPAAEVLIARLEGEPVGFALFYTSFSTFLGRPGLYLEDLFVQPEARGRGVGTALLRRLAALAKQRGCGRLEWAVLDWNQPAIEFYHRLGARPMSQWITCRMEGEALDRLAKEGAE